MGESNILQRCIDNEYHVISIINEDHSMIHRGKYFTVAQSTTILGASSWIDFYLETNSSYEMHLKQLDVTNSGGLLSIQICEGGTTMILGATTCISYNRDRNSTITSPFNINKNTSWGSTTGGITSSQTNIISQFYIGTTGTNATRLGGSESNTLEWILKTSTTYIIRLNNLGSAGYASLRLHYYY